MCASTTDKQGTAVAFYAGLYTADAVNNVDINFFTSQIPDSAKIPDTDHTALCTPFAADELLDAAARAPKQSSPGVDSLPYAIPQLLFTHAATSSIAVSSVYSDALLKGIFPTSWQETCLALLPKKGDLTLLQNWRPISLICCDAKVFTRLLNARLMTHFVP